MKSQPAIIKEPILTLQSRKWETYPPAPDHFLRAGSEHPVLLQVLYNRGITEPGHIAHFLNGHDVVREDPYRLQDMATATRRIIQAIREQETICVYGDFDADGVTATALLVSALEQAGARVGAYIPSRVDEGYGLNVETIQALAPKADLLITVDCGIRSVEEVAEARRNQLDVIVTDHHTIGPDLPPALAVINPQRRDNPGSVQQLAGVGVAYRLAQAVLRAASQENLTSLDLDQVAAMETELLDLVAIGTVADMMPLWGENRSLVRRGIEQLRQTERPGLLNLFQHASLPRSSVDSAAISFRIAPRINAAGRLAHAGLAYSLLRTEEQEKASLLAQKLEELNQERQRKTQEAQQEAEIQLADSAADAFILIASSKDFLPGVVGLVAGRLAEQYYRPAVVIEEGNEYCRGSARSIDEFDISRALDEVRDLLVRHGGHSLAAGFTVAADRLPDLRAALAEIAERELSQYPELRPTLWIDTEVDLDEANWALREQLARLEPTGQGNQVPLFLARGCRVQQVRAVGKGKHLKLTLDQGPGTPTLGAIAFRQGHWGSHLGYGSQIDVVYQLETNEWQGRKSLQLNVQDIRPHGSE